MPIAHPVRTPRRRFPRADEPPFTASHWVSRPGAMPLRSAQLPTGNTAIYQGRLYVIYQGFFQNVSGVNWWVGGIVSTADGLTWSTAFEGAGPTTAQYRMPTALFVRGDTLYCVMNRGGFPYAEVFVYLTDGEIAIWKTTNGVSWAPHQTLVSWPSAGAWENIGHRGAAVSFTPTPVWRAAGSGPADETADWLITGYHAYAEVPGAPVVHTATPQYRSLDNGETWTQVRNMKGVYPFSANPSAAEGPNTVLGVPRPGVALDRWVMVGGPTHTNFVNYSDDAGATWTGSTATGGHTGPSDAKILQTGGMVFVLPGTGAFGPGEQISCDYGASRLLISTSGVGGDANSTFGVLQFGTAGGDELLASTKSGGQRIWHSTNGGETWADRGAIAVGFAVSYTLARAPNGRTLLYNSSGGSAAMDLWTCDDAPTDVWTPRTICPFVVEPPDNVGPPPPCPPAWGFTPVPCAQPCPTTPEGAEIAALLAPILARRRALYTPRFPEFTCARPLGAFVLGSHCLGVLPPVSVTTPPYERDGTCLLTGLEVFTNAPCPPTPVPGPRI